MDTDKINPETVDISKFCLEKVLNQDDHRKTITLLGNFGDLSKKCVIILAKTPFKSAEISPTIGQLLTPSKQYFENDIFRNFAIFSGEQLRELDSKTIYPATEKLISKSATKELVHIEETPEFYNEVTLPLYIQKTDIKNYEWMYQVLEKKAEAEDIIYEDTDPEKGFVLVPSWSCKQADASVEELHVLAIAHNRSLSSLRDLNEKHVEMLENIHARGLQEISEKYKISRTKLKACIHYLPTYFHLHIHFAHVRKLGDTFELGKAIALTDVIQNIKLKSDYYQKATIAYNADANSIMAAEYLKRTESNDS